MTPVQTSLVALLVVTTVIIAVLGVLAAKLILNLILLSKNVDSIAQSVQTEVEPTLKELREAAHSINSIANNADTQITGVQSALKNLFSGSGIIQNKMKGAFVGLLKGISFGIDLFRKK